MIYCLIYRSSKHILRGQRKCKINVFTTKWLSSQLKKKKREKICNKASSKTIKLLKAQEKPIKCQQLIALGAIKTTSTRPLIEDKKYVSNTQQNIQTT